MDASYITEQISQIELYKLIAAGLIAFLGTFTKYRLISSVLFIEFLVMIGYQSVIIGPDDYLRPAFAANLYYMTYAHIWALFLMVKILIQTILMLTYSEIEECESIAGYRFKPLMSVSAVIIGFLIYEMFATLLGFVSTGYESYMAVFSTLQLIIGFIGVIGGSGLLFNHIRHRFGHRGHKGT